MKNKDILILYIELSQELFKAYSGMIYLANKVNVDKDLDKYFENLKSLIEYSNIKIDNIRVDIKKIRN